VTDDERRFWEQVLALSQNGETSMETMVCLTCGFRGDDVQDFISTDSAGERLCPKCGSEDCHMIGRQEAGRYCPVYAPKSVAP
jgi:anaerobic ribonucleoside-triphosphate reductase